jgi:hypothetical protein
MVHATMWPFSIHAWKERNIKIFLVAVETEGIRENREDSRGAAVQQTRGEGRT